MKYAKTYKVMYSVLKSFMKDMIKLDYSTPKAKAWMDAYKGEGAYYTCKNLIMFHGCKVLANNGFHSTEDSMTILKNNLVRYQDEGWRMFAFMKKLIEDNNINTKTHIAEVCNK